MIGLCSASEIPAIGRCKPYIITLFLFVLFQIPTALVSNFAAYLFFRFMAGLVGSPPLATGGASVGDVFAPTKAPLALGLWGLSASAGPVLGPIIGAFAAQGFGYDWRWTIWPLLMLSGFTLILLTFSMPESSATNILHRRAERLRQVSGNPHLRSKGEIFAATLTGKEIAMMTFVRPFRLGLFEPIALSINLHIGMVYGVLYVWFEAFPLVFAQTYGFSLGVSTLPFLGILVGNLITYYIFFLWFTKYYRPKLIASKGAVAPEYWLHPAMVGAIFLPLSLFAFGWTSNRSIHWIVPVISSGLFSVGIFGLFTSGLNYLAVSYPDYLASVFSANDFTRGMIGAGLPLVARAMFNNLQANGPKAFPVSWGCTLLGCVSTLLAPVPYLLYFYGPALRKASKFAKDPSEGASKEDDEESNQGQSQQEKSPRREESTPSEQSVQSERSA
jgi:DHA1 family multidrug resistance protein-like MFS transporter